jgi:hypothetical protein
MPVCSVNPSLLGAFKLEVTHQGHIIVCEPIEVGHVTLHTGMNFQGLKVHACVQCMATCKPVAIGCTQSN